VKIAKDELVRMLRTEGDNDTADQAESRLPDEIDTDADDGALAKLAELTERYCVVAQTLAEPPRLTLRRAPGR
jgi:hypothetical protein